MTLSVSETVQRGTVGWLVNNGKDMLVSGRCLIKLLPLSLRGGPEEKKNINVSRPTLEPSTSRIQARNLTATLACLGLQVFTRWALS